MINTISFFHKYSVKLETFTEALPAFHSGSGNRLERFSITQEGKEIEDEEQNYHVCARAGPGMLHGCVRY